MALAAGSSLAAHTVEPLRETAFFHKGFFLGGYLAVEEIAREIQQ